jgi:UDP-N-acetylglucosamine 2-epimerase (non-hydrolysing)
VSAPLVINVVGARPQFVKAGPVSRALAAAGIRELLVDTGQHYDEIMTGAIARGVGLRQPNIDLAVGSGLHGAQTAAILQRLEEVLVEHQPDAVVLYGDTNSTVAAALAATKLHIPAAHVEAGLRSFNRRMPEELNRVAADHLCDLLLAPTTTAMINLEAEGLVARARLVGDVMVDALRSVDLAAVTPPAWAEGEYLVATIHRAENTDDPARLQLILDEANGLSRPVHLLAHPRLRARMAEFGLTIDAGSLYLHEPLPYATMLKAMAGSQGLITDSGGLQKEAYVLRIPCVTLRGETEWPETLQGDWNVLLPAVVDLEAVTRRTVAADQDAPFGDGDTAHRIVAELVQTLT